MADIVSMIEEKDEMALEILKKEYGDLCYKIIFGLLRNEKDCEEVLNDVWLNVWNAIPPAKPNNIRAYLAKTARNCALHYIERNNAKKRKGITVLLDELDYCIPNPVSLELLDSILLRDLLNTFLHNLPREERIIFIRRYWYGAEIYEIAEMLHCSTTRISGILFRVRRKLYKLLEREGYSV